jgi:hypothetical protein
MGKNAKISWVEDKGICDNNNPGKVRKLKNLMLQELWNKMPFAKALGLSASFCFAVLMDRLLSFSIYDVFCWNTAISLWDILWVEKFN